MVKLPSKHGLERKFKPWRKGKSKLSKIEASKKSNTSLKNQLRGQKRLLSKLTNNEASADSIEGVKQRIAQIEKDIDEYEAREKEKKNAAKYHKVKFYERQKLTRLEKSTKRQLEQLSEKDGEKSEEKISQLQNQLLSIGMDQLYVAFYPTSMKYITLFKSGSVDRFVGDEKVQRRRKDVWNKIREQLLKEIQKTDSKSNSEAFINAKKWVNWDAAKKALMSMPADIYPNCPSSIIKEQDSKVASTEDQSAVDETPDNRFTMTKEFDGLFHESTTGDDYQAKLKAAENESDDSSESDASDSSSEDDADPLAGQKETKTNHDVDGKVQQPASSSSSSASSSSSSASSSEEEDDDSDNPDSKPKVQTHIESEAESEEDEADDFFAAGTVSAGDVFAQLQNDQMKKKNSRQFGEDDQYMPGEKRKADKSKGFSTQRQSKRDFRAYQQRQRRQKFG